MKRDFVFTSESVAEGHPDKLCDQVSDAVVDHYLAADPAARVLAECAVATGILFLATHVTTGAQIDASMVARDTIRAIGYRRDSFDAESCSILISRVDLPADSLAVTIPPDVDPAVYDNFPAQNQVTVFGFACRQTPSLMPLPITLAHRLVQRLGQVRHDGSLGYLRPDGKCQVAIEYRDRRPLRVHGLTLIADADPGIGAPRLTADLRETVIEPVLAEHGLATDGETRMFLAAGEQYLVGGPATHAGLTGRKTAVDTYGEYARQSGSALSGKDPSRVDRIGAYAARWAAKTIVTAGLADECEVQLTYAIGMASPVSVQVDCFGTERIPEERILARLLDVFDFRPAALRHALKFGRQSRDGAVRFQHLSVFGHVGRDDLDLPWERTDRADALRD
jgi:S-adenosylmethionine synthetase